MMSSEKPKPQGLKGGLSIGPPTAAWSGGGATHLASESFVDRWVRVGSDICPPFLVFLVLFLVLFAAIYIDKDYPSFTVEWVSVSVDNNLKYPELVTAAWNLGFTVENSNRHSSFDFQDFDVWVQCMSQDWSGTVVAPFSQGPKNTTFVNATVSALLPRYDPPRLIPGLILEFEVMFRVRFPGYKVQAICNDMRVGFSWNATKGMMVGGPRLCPMEYHSYD